MVKDCSFGPWSLGWLHCFENSGGAGNHGGEHMVKLTCLLPGAGKAGQGSECRNHGGILLAGSLPDSHFLTQPGTTCLGNDTATVDRALLH